MGYCVEYNPEKKKKYPMSHSGKPKWMYFLVASVIVILFAFSVADKRKLGSFLIPGDPDVTSAAFSELVYELESGASVSDAITAFCLEIIHND